VAHSIIWQIWFSDAGFYWCEAAGKKRMVSFHGQIFVEL
jgi:hypothetical protein